MFTVLTLVCVAGCGGVADSTGTPASAPDTTALAELPVVTAGASLPGPTTSVAAIADWSWLDAFGPESAVAAVPAGWRLMDVGVLRFAVPDGWAAPISRSCLQPEPVGVVLLDFLAPLATCSPEIGLPDGRLIIDFTEAEPPSTAPDVKVGQYDAWQLSDAPLATYRLANGIEISIGGPDAAQTLATFSDSGAQRVLHNGPVVETAEWTTVTVDDVSLLVPSGWDVVDLPHQDPNRGFFPNPGTCNDAWFYVEAPRAFTGETDSVPSCILVRDRPTTPTDGVWIRDIAADTSTPGPIVAHGTTNGLDISVVDRTLPDNDTVSPTLDLLVHTPSHVVRVSIGVGSDPTIARTILRSLHAA